MVGRSRGAGFAGGALESSFDVVFDGFLIKFYFLEGDFMQNECGRASGPSLRMIRFLFLVFMKYFVFLCLSRAALTKISLPTKLILQYCKLTAFHAYQISLAQQHRFTFLEGFVIDI